LNNGGDFAQLAKDRSSDTASAEKGGDLGCNLKGSFVPEFEEAVLNASTGDTLGPVKSEFGYHVIRVDHEYGPQSFDEVSDEIATTLAGEQGWLEWKMYSSKIDRQQEVRRVEQQRTPGDSTGRYDDEVSAGKRGRVIVVGLWSGRRRSDQPSHP
jgi:hypothetical protein